MSQFNMHLTPDFEKTLVAWMRIKGVVSRSQAVRIAVQTALERSEENENRIDFVQLIGLGNRAPLNPKQRFTSDDALWEK